MYKKLLIVDDEPDMLMLLSMLIKEKTTYEPVATNNPLEALELVKQGGIDLVIAELKMPALDGIELLEAVKRVDEDIPVVIMASYGTFEAALEAMSKGAFDFIAKPFRKEQMLFAIDKAFRWKRLQRENKLLTERIEKVEKRCVCGSAVSSALRAVE